MYEPLSLASFFGLIRLRSEWVESLVGAEGTEGEDFMLSYEQDRLKAWTRIQTFQRDSPEIHGLHSAGEFHLLCVI